MSSQCATPVNAMLAAPARSAGKQADAGAPADSAPAPFAKVLQQQTGKAANSAADATPKPAPDPSPDTTTAVPEAASAPADGLAALIAAFLPYLQVAALPAQAKAPAEIETDDRNIATDDAGSLAGNALPLIPGLAVATRAEPPVSTKAAAESGEQRPPAANPTAIVAVARGRGDDLAAARAAATPAGADQPAKMPSDFAALIAARPPTDAPPAPATLAATLAAASSPATAAIHDAAPDSGAKGNGPALTVATPFGQPGWSADVGDRLTWMIGRNEQRAELVLNPPQLGRIEVSLSLHDGEASATFVSANPDVRDAISNALPHLREALADVGVSLGQTQVGAGSTGQSANPGENGDNRRGVSGAGNAPGSSPMLAGGKLPPGRAGGRGLVDVFA